MIAADEMKRKQQQNDGQGPPIQFRSVYLDEELERRDGPESRSTLAKQYLTDYLRLLAIEHEDPEIQFGPKDRKLIWDVLSDCLDSRTLWALVADHGGSQELIDRLRRLSVLQRLALIDLLKIENA